ncbi:MAG: hypothetical protein E6G76_23695 [Alphaproteobacteria bacterium]|nr:MAG: hypothetical protein E6G76_23695 [Alphaproteobacteria bacterium]
MIYGLVSAGGGWMRILTEEERRDILSLWAGFVSAVAIYFLIGSFWKAVLIGAFVGGSAVLGYGTRWLLNCSFAFAVLAIAVALGLPPPDQWLHLLYGAREASLPLDRD